MNTYKHLNMDRTNVNEQILLVNIALHLFTVDRNVMIYNLVSR